LVLISLKTCRAFIVAVVAVAVAVAVVAVAVAG
jgi:hypothetical protein